MVSILYISSLYSEECLGMVPNYIIHVTTCTYYISAADSANHYSNDKKWS